MKIGIFHALLFAAALALVGAWTVGPSATRAHMHSGAAGIHAEQFEVATTAAGAAEDCAAALGVAGHRACCDASTLGCCAPCVLLTPELAATQLGEAPIFATAFAETAAGLPGARLKRPPRPAG